MKQISATDSQVIKACAIACVGLIGLVASFFGGDASKIEMDGEKLVNAGLLVLTTGSVAWAMYARITKPNPPISGGAVQKQADLIQKQTQETVENKP